MSDTVIPTGPTLLTVVAEEGRGTRALLTTARASCVVRRKMKASVTKIKKGRREEGETGRRGDGESVVSKKNITLLKVSFSIFALPISPSPRLPISSIKVDSTNAHRHATRSP